MEKVKVGVSYRHKTTKEVVDLGELELDKPQTVEEAVQLYEGVENLLAYAHVAYAIEQQGDYRNAHRTDKEVSKGSANTRIFKQLSEEKQEELLRAHGLIA